MVKSRKVHSLTGRITIELMRAAFKKVKRNRGAAGVDKVSIGMFGDNLEQNLLALMKDLKSGEFQPVPLRRVHLDKGPHTKKTRPLGIPGVRDRVGQEVLRRRLEPLFEPLFQEASFGFRPKRNCHQAIQWVLSLHDAGDAFVLDADLEGFFDNLPQDVILQLVADKVADGNILRLLQRFLTAGVMEDGVFKPTTVGTPQGGVISPLLANIVLNQLDWALDPGGLPQKSNTSADWIVAPIVALSVGVNHAKSVVAGGPIIAVSSTKVEQLVSENSRRVPRQNTSAKLAVSLKEAPKP